MPGDSFKGGPQTQDPETPPAFSLSEVLPEISQDRHTGSSLFLAEDKIDAVKEHLESEESSVALAEKPA